MADDATAHRGPGGRVAGIASTSLLVNAALFVGALISIARTRRHTTGSQVVWALTVVVLPVIGALAWFVIGRRAKKTITLRP